MPPDPQPAKVRQKSFVIIWLQSALHAHKEWRSITKTSPFICVPAGGDPAPIYLDIYQNILWHLPKFTLTYAASGVPAPGRHCPHPHPGHRHRLHLSLRLVKIICLQHCTERITTVTWSGLACFLLLDCRGCLKGPLISVQVCPGVLMRLQCENVLTSIRASLPPRTMLGPIAAPGGSVFALLVLIILALIGDHHLHLHYSLHPHLHLHHPRPHWWFSSSSWCWSSFDSWIPLVLPTNGVFSVCPCTELQNVNSFTRSKTYKPNFGEQMLKAVIN